MSVYRRLTRDRTLASLEEFETNDRDLKSSIRRLVKPPREARWKSSFEIQEDYICPDDREVSSRGRSRSRRGDRQRGRSWDRSESPDSREQYRSYSPPSSKSRSRSPSVEKTRYDDRDRKFRDVKDYHSPMSVDNDKTMGRKNSMEDLRLDDWNDENETKESSYSSSISSRENDRRYDDRRYSRK